MTGSPRDLTAKDWQSSVLESTQPVAVAFWHEHCAWSKRLDSDLSGAATERSTRIAFYKLNVSREPEITRRLGVMSTPTIKFFYGGREVYEIVGYRSRAALLAEVDMVLANYANCLSSSTPLGAR